MSQDEMTRLTAALKTDETFHAEFFAARSFDEAAVAAAQRGCAVTVNDLKALAGETQVRREGELSDAELQGAGGGANGLFASFQLAMNKVARMVELQSRMLAQQHEAQKGIAKNIR